MLRSLGENLTSQDFIKIALGKQHVFVILQNGDVRRPLVVPYPVLLQAIASSIDLPSGTAAWGSIATGTGVGSQTDLVTYLNANYIDPTELSSALSNYVPTSRTLTINGTTYDLSANRSWTISGGGAVDSVNGQTGVVVLELNDIDDVNAPSPTVGQVLQWNGTEWVAATIPGGGTVTSISAGTGMSFTTITGSGAVAIDITKVPYIAAGFSAGFLKWNGAAWVFDNSSFLSVGANISLLTNDAGFITAAALAPYLTLAAADLLYYPLVGNPSGFLTSAALANYVQNTRAINTSGSLTGGGNLSADRTLQLVNDNATPGNQKYYGTDVSGTKGFYSFPSGNYAIIVKAVNGTPITGTANTISLSGLVPANTNAANDILRVKYRVSKIGTAAATTTRLYVNTTNSLSGATLLAQVSTAAASRFLQSERELFIKNGLTITEVWPTASAAFTDNAVASTPASVIAINHTVDQYYFVALQNGITGEISTCEFLRIERT